MKKGQYRVGVEVAKLVALAEQLRDGLAELEARLNAPPPPRPVRLDQKFFWGRLFPVLERFPEGLTNRQIRDRLPVVVQPPAFRLFLNRLRKAGFVEVEQANNYGVWRLSKKARDRSKV